MRIARFNLDEMNPKKVVEYLDPIADYGVGDEEPRWETLFKLRHAKIRYYPEVGFKFVKSKDKKSVYIHITDKENEEGYVYISEPYRMISEEGKYFILAGHTVLTLPKRPFIPKLTAKGELANKVSDFWAIEPYDPAIIGTMLSIIYKDSSGGILYSRARGDYERELNPDSDGNLEKPVG